MVKGVSEFAAATPTTSTTTAKTSQDNEQASIYLPYNIEVGAKYGNYSNGTNDKQFRTPQPTGFLNIDLKPYLNFNDRPFGFRSKIEAYGGKDIIGAGVKFGAEGLVSNPDNKDFQAYIGGNVGVVGEYHLQQKDWFLDDKNADKRYNWCDKTLMMKPNDLAGTVYAELEFNQGFSNGLKLHQSVGAGYTDYTSLSNPIPFEKIPAGETARENFERRANEAGIAYGTPVNPINGYVEAGLEYTIPKSGVSFTGDVRLNSNKLFTENPESGVSCALGVKYNFGNLIKNK